MSARRRTPEARAVLGLARRFRDADREADRALIAIEQEEDVAANNRRYDAAMDLRFETLAALADAVDALDAAEGEGGDADAL